MNYETVFGPSDESLQPIRQGLHDYNLHYLGAQVIETYERVAIFARDDAGRVIGGVYGEMYWEWLHIDTLWVDEALRGQGIGRRLLAMVEEAAIAKGYFKAHLETTNFQALDFYLEHGYQIFGELEGKPAGSTWYYIKKALSEPEE